MSAALPLTTLIAQSSSKRKAWKMKTASLGNGYSQSLPFGMNYERDEWDINYENLTETDRDTVVGALNTVGSWDYLTWTAFGDTTSKRWKISGDGYRESFADGHYNISFTLAQTQ